MPKKKGDRSGRPEPVEGEDAVYRDGSPPAMTPGDYTKGDQATHPGAPPTGGSKPTTGDKKPGYVEPVIPEGTIQSGLTEREKYLLGRVGERIDSRFRNVIDFVRPLVDRFYVGRKRDESGKIVEQGTPFKDYIKKDILDAVKGALQPAADRLNYLKRLFGYEVEKGKPPPEPKDVLAGYGSVSEMAGDLRKLREEIEELGLEDALRNIGIKQEPDLSGLVTRGEYDALAGRIGDLEKDRARVSAAAGSVEGIRKDVGQLKSNVAGLRSAAQQAKPRYRDEDIDVILERLGGMENKLSRIDNNLGVVIDDVMDPGNEKLLKDDGKKQ